MISSKIKVILVIFLTVSFAACADNLTNPGSDTPLEPRELTVDRPFVFIIHERTSGVNLFMGKVKNPNS